MDATFSTAMQCASQRPVAPLSGPLGHEPFSERWGLLNKKFLSSSFFEGPRMTVEFLRNRTPWRHGGFVNQLEPSLAPLSDTELLQRIAPFHEGPARGLANTEERKTLEDVLPFLMAVRQCIEAEQLLVAREMLNVASPDILSNPLVKHLRALLAPPVIKRVEKKDIDRSREYEWIRTESRKYRGKWVALQGESLVATATTLRELRQRLQTQPPAQTPFIHRID